MYTIDVPVKPYVKKFITARYRQPVWDLNKQDRVGKVLYSMLERMPDIYKKSTLNYGATLSVRICDEYAARKGLYLSNDSIFEFNDFVQLELIEDVAMYIWQLKTRIGLKKYNELYIRHQSSTRLRTHVIQNPQIFQYFEKREIIYDIFKQYDITEDDFPFETIYKATQRLKLPLLTA